jgi:hypothetical protein
VVYIDTFSSVYLKTQPKSRNETTRELNRIISSCRSQLPIWLSLSLAAQRQSCTYQSHSRDFFSALSFKKRTKSYLFSFISTSSNTTSIRSSIPSGNNNLIPIILSRSLLSRKSIIQCPCDPLRSSTTAHPAASIH